MTDVLSSAPIEEHPLRPFLPVGGRVLLLGSFPPPVTRWCMHFFYPNYQNDMWRIIGYLFKGDRLAFVDSEHKTYRLETLRQFLEETGLAFYDTACAVRRLKANASDKYLEVVKQTDIAALLQQMPLCHAIATTGQKAAETLGERLGVTPPAVGHVVETQWAGRQLRFYRMPSSSRAYPIALEKKAAVYHTLFRAEGILP